MTDGTITQQVRHAYERAPAIRQLFDEAGLDPATVTTFPDLDGLPVTSKEALLERQLAAPPFGGYFAGSLEDVTHVFVSPGPIYEPEMGRRADAGYASAYRRAGIGPGDIVLNCWSYHLVRAGMMVDAAARAAGATVVPAGVGSSELHARVIVDLGITVIASSTPYFEILLAKLTELGHELPAAWKVRIAVLGGEPGAWAAKRQRFEQTLGLLTVSTYGTADIGLVGAECADRDGYHAREDLHVSICSPDTGAPLPPGETGEVVVTNLDPVYPLIRFGTGDAAHQVAALCSCGDAPGFKISHLEGRVTQAIKVRQVFVYPRHAAEIEQRVPGVHTLRMYVRSRGVGEQLDLAVGLHAGVALSDVEESLRSAVTNVTRLRAGTIEEHAEGTAVPEAVLTDERVHS